MDELRKDITWHLMEATAADPALRPWPAAPLAARALREDSVNLFGPHIGITRMVPPPSLCAVLADHYDPAIRAALEYNVLTHYVRRLADRIRMELYAGRALDLEPATEHTADAIVTLVLEVRAFAWAEILLRDVLLPLRAEVAALTPRPDEGSRAFYILGRLERAIEQLQAALAPRWLALSMAAHPRLGARAPLHGVQHDDLRRALLRGAPP